MRFIASDPFSRLTLALSALLGFALLAFASVAVAQLAGSAHDFSANTWAGGKICVVCHTPHGADLTVPDSPLWNHEVTSAVYTVYSSPTLDVAAGQPGGASKLCLSCHDGTVAIDSFGGAVGSQFVTGGALIGTDLSDDHPIGIEWEHQTQTPPCGNCHNPRDPGDGSRLVTPFFGAPGSRTLECPTCHDAHGTSGEPWLLRITPVGSTLCFYCHLK